MNGVPQKLSVYINAECAATLRRVMQKRDISVTEAIRRAISLLDWAERRAAADELVALTEEMGLYE